MSPSLQFRVRPDVASPPRIEGVEGELPLWQVAPDLAAAAVVPMARPEPSLGDWFRFAFAYGRVQLVVGFLFAIVLPTAVRAALGGQLGLTHLAVSESLNSQNNTLIGATLALVLGFLALRQIRAFPGALSAVHAPWVFSGAYAVLLLALVFGRFDYSRFMLGAFYVMTVIWFVLMHFTADRGRSIRLAFIGPRGRERLPQAPQIEWMPLPEPRLASPVGAVVADLKARHAPEWQAFLTRCALAGLPIMDVKQVSEMITGRVQMEHLSENSLAYTVHATAYRKVKRAIDTALVIVASPVILFLVGVAAALAQIGSPGPIFFSQTRMGFRGRPFRILKLRTMRVGSESGGHFTAEEDPRVTPIGRVLRKYRLDELPQAWNILLGHMSWVGPRPEALPLAQWYEDAVPFYAYRHIVRPGITGWAQVHQGNVAEIEAASVKLQYDFFYIKNLSLWLDVAVAVKTVRTILTGFGAR